MTTTLIAEMAVERWRERGWLDNLTTDTVFWMKDEVEAALNRAVREAAETTADELADILAEGEYEDYEE